MNIKNTSAVILNVLVLNGSILAISGCDNGSGGSASSNPSPDPPDPTPPAAVVPVAKAVTVNTLYTTKKLKGYNDYSDDKGRLEGKSAALWLYEQNNTVSNINPLPINASLYNKTLRYCVTPTTFDGVSGKQICSARMQVKYQTKPVSFITDWNTDTDFINDPDHGDVRNRPSGNIHFYYNINLQLKEIPILFGT